MLTSASSVCFGGVGRPSPIYFTTLLLPKIGISPLKSVLLNGLRMRRRARSSVTFGLLSGNVFPTPCTDWNNHRPRRFHDRAQKVDRVLLRGMLWLPIPGMASRKSNPDHIDN